MCYDTKQLITQLQEYQKKVTVSKEAALKALRKAGLIDKNNKPTKPYGRQFNFLC